MIGVWKHAGLPSLEGGFKSHIWSRVTGCHLVLFPQGALAQLGEHDAGSVGVTGSSPVGSIYPYSRMVEARRNVDAGYCMAGSGSPSTGKLAA